MTARLESSLADRFGVALSARVMGPRLGAALGTGTARCHVLDAKLEPGVRAVVLYETAGRLVRGDVLPAGGSGGVVVDPGVRLSPFPHDPDLPSLPRVMDPAELGPLLAAALVECGSVERDSAWARRPDLVRLALLRYRPEKRATVLATHSGSALALVAKAYHRDDKAAAVVAEAPSPRGGRGGVLAFARTAAYVPELALVVQEVVSGTPLDALTTSRRPDTAAARAGVVRAAAALAELHQQAVVTTRQRPVDRELTRFGERAARVGTVDRGLGEAAAALAHRLGATQRLLPPPRVGPVHGDCKPSQFLLGRTRVCVLDLDHVGVSDQAGDVGTFLASLRQQGIRRRLANRGPADEALDTLAASFLDGYLRAGGEVGDLPRIHWHVAVALERKALRAFARAPRSPMAAALIQEAQRCLDDLREAA
ncbi:hypothetical protein P0Y31_13390 [Knoellia sp. 3-2P3]|uniref:hypothetical protein n=1 Tax=unclassified Knoellia TaxID=2618719 RepID=UPI0023DC4347|nr:hypothetical protein [Knoellia sp. 3-2P3]MDF2093339.1 hypothetical protein [Knoellia sp. 3-2P3]